MSTLFTRWGLFKLDDVITERNTCVARVEAAECPAGGRRGEFESESVAPFPRPRSKPALLLARRHLGPIFRFSLLDCLQVTEQDETAAARRAGGQSGDGAAFEAITICVHDESERAAASLIRRGEEGREGPILIETRPDRLIN